MQVGDLVTWKDVDQRELGIVTYVHGNMAKVQWSWGSNHHFFHNLEVICE